MSLSSESEQMDLAQQRRLAIEQAVDFASKNQWGEAIAVNRQIIKSFGEDTESLNRLGRAYMENGQLPSAIKAYKKALKIEPLNRIALRNLDRLVEASPPKEKKGKIREKKVFFLDNADAVVFLELEAVDLQVINLLHIGDSLGLKVEGSAVHVVNEAGQYLGMLAPQVGIRLSRLLDGGNKYEIALADLAIPIRVAIREEYVHPSQVGKSSFTTKTSRVSAKIRGYTRRSLLVDDREPEAFPLDEDDLEMNDNFETEQDESGRLTLQEEGVIGTAEEDGGEF
tara:strand:+ start:7632 stop:8480 length:849 start_codon:yes stop_codon:yes gene_type:complete